MKGKHILIAFITTVVLGVLSILSLKFVDKFTLNDFLTKDWYIGYSSDDFNPTIYKLAHTDKDLKKIDKLVFEDFPYSVEIQEGEDGLNVYGLKEDMNYEEFFSYEVKDKTLYIRGKSLDEDLVKKYKPYLIFSVARPSDLEIEAGSISKKISLKAPIKSLKIGNLMGYAEIEAPMEKLEIEKLIGVADIETRDSFDMDFGEVSGVLDFEIDSINAFFEVEKVLGVMTIMDENVLSPGWEKSYGYIFGNERDTIKIGKLTGVLTVED